MYTLFRPLLFRLDPEVAHWMTLQAIGLAGRLPPVRSMLTAFFRGPQHPVQAFGLTFPNPVGLAAGYDKDATGWRGLTSLGFGHIEIGTITPRPQPGNPKPRLFRLVPERAVINRMGFPGKGADFAARQLPGTAAMRKVSPCIIGINIGKNKDTPLEEATRDYTSLMRTLGALGDYLAINISSPNTVGLRRLQGRELLEGLLTALAHERQAQAEAIGRHVPLLVKLAPDLSDAELDDALDAIQRTGMDGVIATNTTISREGIRSPLAAESGGLSGAPLRARSTEMIRKIAARTHGKLPIIGVGGVSSADDVREKLDAGVVLIQIYTGLIYEGPTLVKKILQDL
ncbi:MAG: quinone-dependent dihydroorotate dehydrogenase [Chloroflexota bacterium]